MQLALPRLQPVSLPGKVAVTLSLVGILIASANVTAWFWPVPMTLQTLAVMGIALAAPRYAALAAIVTYMGLAMWGQPFSASPTPWDTYGYVIGFGLMALLVLRFREAAYRNIWLGWVLALTASALVYIPGVLWLHAATGLGWQAAFMDGVAPFLLADIAKSLIAATSIRLWSIYRT
jgi:biotin transport system substrate-specific component